MQLITTINGKHFAAGLTKVLKIKSTNAALPAIECVHLLTLANGVVLTATNLDTTIITGIQAKTEKKDMQLLIPPQAVNVLKLLNNDKLNIEIHADAKELQIRYNKNVLRLQLEDAGDFPKTPDTTHKIEFTTTDNAEVVARLFEIAKGFTSLDDLRPAMSGIHWDGKELAATDAFRLCIIPADAGKEFDIILSKDGAKAMGAFDPKNPLRMRISENHISINDKATKVISRLIDAKYPSYRAVLPVEFAYAIEVNRTDLISNLKILMNIVNQTTRRMEFTFEKERYELRAGELDFMQEMVMEGTCTWGKKKPAEPFMISYNGIFLMQALETMEGETVTFQVNESDKPTVMNEDGYLYLLMPLTPPPTT